MKILNSAQIRRLDQATINERNIQPLDLMEQAATALFEWINKHYSSKDQKIAIICGPGNNGGDGLALTRILAQAGYLVQAYLVADHKSQSTECQINFQRSTNLVQVVQGVSQLPNLKPFTLVVDALFGNGLTRPLEGLFKAMVEQINQCRQVIAIDIASGLFADQPTDHLPTGPSTVVKPQITLSFQLPKLAFLAAENALFVGDWYLLDIGLSQSCIQTTASPYVWLDSIELPELKHRHKHAHKGDFGHLLALNGSLGKLGAAILAAKAALRGGVGKLTNQVPKSGINVLQTAVPDAMCNLDPHQHYLTEYPDLQDFDAIMAGPGLGQAASTQAMLQALLKHCQLPIVLDADAINCLKQTTRLPKNSLVTPHLKEFKRWLGGSKNSFERWQKQLDYSAEYAICVLLKGHHSSVSTDEAKLYFNSTGTPALATAGSGDVLTGVLGALLAQGYSTPAAALLGVYWHGLAGQLAAQKAMNLVSVIASDVVEQLGFAYQELETLTQKLPYSSPYSLH